MKAYDFEFDGITLSEMGYTICNFDSQSLETISAGSTITFNTVSTLRGQKFNLTSTEYESCLTTTFQICKDQCAGDGLEISREELAGLMRWLNREEFCKFRLLEENYSDVYFEGSFNVSRLDFNGETVGLELTLKTNRPFALQEEKSFTFSATSDNTEFSLIDSSEKEGYIYPLTEITISKSGTFSIYNEIEDRTTTIANCTQGEVITMNYPVITSSISTHAIQNDFNWTFFRVANSYDNLKNCLTISLPSTVKITYSPIAKVGF